MAIWKRLDDLSESDRHANVSLETVGLWAYILGSTDSCGRRSAEPAIVRAKVLTMRAKVTDEWIDARLAELASIGLIHLYAVDGRRYLVMHQVSKYNPPGNLKNIRPSYPPPPPICDCLTYHPSERLMEALNGGIPPQLRPSVLGSSGSSLSESSEEEVKEEKPPALKAGSNEHQLAAEWNNGSGFPITADKGARLIRCTIDAGADPQAIQVAIWDRDKCKGRKLWQVLDPLIPSEEQKKHDELMAWAKKYDAEKAVS